MANNLFYLGAVLLIVWGISHLIPTKNVVNGFGEISKDNRLIITMEWIVEGVSFIFIGSLVAVITYLDPVGKVSFAAYSLSAGVIFILAIVSFFSGFKIKFLPFRMCPFVLSASGLLVVVGLLVQN